MAVDSSTLTLREIRRVFKRHRGAAAQLARDLERKPNSISQYLKGKFPSKPLQEATTNLALQLLAEEQRQATGDAQ